MHKENIGTRGATGRISDESAAATLYKECVNLDREGGGLDSPSLSNPDVAVEFA